MSCDFGNFQMFSEPKFILWKSVVKNIKKYGIFKFKHYGIDLNNVKRNMNSSNNINENVTFLSF